MSRRRSRGVPGMKLRAARLLRDRFRLGSHLGSQSVRIINAHRRPKRADGLLKHAGRSVLNCGSQNSKAREGSRAGVGSHPTPTAI